MSDSGDARVPERPLWEQLADVASADGVRLQKVLAERGFGSRRVCEDLIGARRVRVNGDIAVLGRRVKVEQDRIEVDDVPVPSRPDFVYYLLNKPAGVVTTSADTHGRPIVVDLVPGEPRVYPVGRLDAETEGLLILTNDGELTHRLTHPSFGVDKEYLAHVEGVPTRAAIARLRSGIDLDDGPTAPATVSQPELGLIKIAIHEGRNRQVRRMCDAIGHPVIRLARVRIGGLADRRLAPGAYRKLTVAEVRGLYEAAHLVPTTL